MGKVIIIKEADFSAKALDRVTIEDGSVYNKSVLIVGYMWKTWNNGVKLDTISNEPTPFSSNNDFYVNAYGSIPVKAGQTITAVLRNRNDSGNLRSIALVERIEGTGSVNVWETTPTESEDVYKTFTLTASHDCYALLNMNLPHGTELSDDIVITVE